VIGEQSSQEQIVAVPSSKKESSRVSFGLAQLIVGIAVGAAASWAFLFAALDRASPFVDGALHVLLPMLGAVGLVLGVAIPVTVWGVRRFLKSTHGTIERVVLEASATILATAQRDASKAVTHAERAIREGLAWYGPIAVRRWVARTALSLLVAFGGLVGTARLFRQILLLGEQNKKLQEQTLLLRDQNAKIDVQNVTAEAQRRAGLVAELFSILQEATRQVAEKEKIGQPRPIKLDASLVARVVALSRTATPYWTMEILNSSESNKLMATPRISDRPRSPERGQLLVGLIAAGVDLTAISLQGADFASADLRGALLREAQLSAIELKHADLRGANLENANLSRSNLFGADLTCKKEMHTRSDPAWVFGSSACTQLGNSDLRGTSLILTSLDGAQMHGAHLGCTGMMCTDLRASEITPSTNLEGAKVDEVSRLEGIPPAGWELFDDDGTLKLRRSKRTK
jgi:uncharacterized protein YjbI with pentapeptide repeats